MEILTYYLLIINTLAAGLIAYDKLCAIRGHWRVPESTLFTMAVLGGSPTVFVMMTYLRHKSNKASFRWRINVILGVQIIALCALFLIM